MKIHTIWMYHTHGMSCRRDESQWWLRLWLNRPIRDEQVRPRRRCVWWRLKKLSGNDPSLLHDKPWTHRYAAPRINSLHCCTPPSKQTCPRPEFPTSVVISATVALHHRNLHNPSSGGGMSARRPLSPLQCQMCTGTLELRRVHWTFQAMSSFRVLPLVVAKGHPLGEIISMWSWHSVPLWGRHAATSCRGDAETLPLWELRGWSLVIEIVSSLSKCTALM